MAPSRLRAAAPAIGGAAGSRSAAIPPNASTAACRSKSAGAPIVPALPPTAMPTSCAANWVAVITATARPSPPAATRVSIASRAGMTKAPAVPTASA